MTLGTLGQHKWLVESRRRGQTQQASADNHADEWGSCLVLITWRPELDMIISVHVLWGILAYGRAVS